MRRRALRKHPTVQEAAMRFWSSFGALRREGLYLDKGAYVSLHVKIAEAPERSPTSHLFLPVVVPFLLLTVYPAN